VSWNFEKSFCAASTRLFSLAFSLKAAFACSMPDHIGTYSYRWPCKPPFLLPATKSPLRVELYALGVPVFWSCLVPLEATTPPGNRWMMISMMMSAFSGELAEANLPQPSMEELITS